MKVFIRFLSLLLVATVSYAQSIRNPEVRIAREAADARDAVRLLSLFGKSVNADVAVLTALGSVQADTTLPVLLSALSSPGKRVRLAAAFAMGQTLRVSNRASEYEERVFARLHSETDGSVLAQLLDALGRFGSARMLDSIAKRTYTDYFLQYAQALAIARFAVRGIHSTEGATLVTAIAQDGMYRESIRENFNPAIYALMRIGDSASIAPATPLLLQAVTSPNIHERMHAVSALGRIRTDAAFAAVRQALADPEPFVRVNAVRTLSRFTSRGHAFMQVVLPLLKETNYHVLKTLLQTLPNLGSPHPRVATTLIGLIDTSASHDIREEAWRAYAQLYPDLAQDKLLGSLAMKNPLPAMLQASGLSATNLKKTNTQLVSWIERNMTHTSRPIATAAVEAWSAFRRIARKHEGVTSGSPADREFENGLLNALRVHSHPASQNPSAVQIIVETAKDSLFRSEEFGRALDEALDRFSSRDNVETVIVLVQGVGSIGDQRTVERLKRLLDDENEAVRKAVAEQLTLRGIAFVPPMAPKRTTTPLKSFGRATNPEAVIRTNRGRIRITLFPDDAPYTVQAFINLAKTGFYNGLTFHRVVPNFVIQGGDPLGDGSGGPPFTLRSEFAPKMFVRGAVGIASAGKDTEGSQFFIMHSTHPHLDGRYTLFGQVTEGMDVVDRVEIGDAIEEVVIIE